MSYSDRSVRGSTPASASSRALNPSTSPMNPALKYQQSRVPEDANLETLSQRLAADLRRHVKRLGTPAPLTAEWFDNVESLQHIGNIAVMEQRLPQAHAASATLWERDDLTVRYMLEEGKLNVTLRAVVNHRNFLRRRAEFEAAVTATANYHKVDRAVVESRVKTCEKCTGQGPPHSAGGAAASTRALNPRVLSYAATYDVASDIWRALARGSCCGAASARWRACRRRTCRC